MIYCLWSPFCVAVICFLWIALDRTIPTERKRHLLGISLGFTIFSGAVSQAIHDPWLFLVGGIIGGMTCYPYIWEANEWEKRSKKEISMSTKSTLQYEMDDATGQLAHLYQDVFDEGHVF